MRGTVDRRGLHQRASVQASHPRSIGDGDSDRDGASVGVADSTNLGAGNRATFGTGHGAGVGVGYCTGLGVGDRDSVCGWRC